MAYEVLMPQLGLTMEEGTVSQWIKHEGDAVKAGDVVVEITTDKLTNEITSEQDGVLLKIVAQEGEDVPVKGLLAYIGQPGEQVGETTAPAVSAASAAPSAEPAAALASAPAASPAAGGKRIRISPLARKIAGQMGVDYTVLTGTGPSGRIVKRDILAAAEAAPAPEMSPGLKENLRQTVTGVYACQNLVIIKTLPGLAPAVCTACRLAFRQRHGVSRHARQRRRRNPRPRRPQPVHGVNPG